MRARGTTTALAVVAALAALAAVGWAGWRGTPRTGAAVEKGEQLVVATTAKRQDLLITVSQTGVVAARKSTPVIPQISGRIQWVCGNGIIVAKDDTILRLDPTKLEEQLADLSARYDDAVRRQAQADTTGKARMTEMRLRLQRARDDVAAFERQQAVTLQDAADAITFHAAELQHNREDLDVKKRLAAKGLVAGTEVERQEAALKAAEFSLQQERSEYELKKSQAAADAGERRRNVNNTARDMSRARSWSERETRMSGNEVDNLKLQVERAREDLPRTTLTAPLAGLVVLSAQGGWRGESHLPRIGDYASQGREIAAIVSLDRMQVKLELDQTQITGVTMGRAAEVTIEALPGKALTGRITAIGQNARRPPIQGWRGLSSTATFPVTVDLPPIGKSLIRPGMRASVRIVTRRVKNVITVPSGCIFRRDGRAVAFVERNGKFVQTAVTTGESNGDYTAITQGLREGDRIALNDLGASPSGSAPAKEQRR